MAVRIEKEYSAVPGGDDVGGDVARWIGGVEALSSFDAEVKSKKMGTKVGRGEGEGEQKGKMRRGWKERREEKTMIMKRKKKHKKGKVI